MMPTVHRYRHAYFFTPFCFPAARISALFLFVAHEEQLLLGYAKVPPLFSARWFTPMTRRLFTENGTVIFDTPWPCRLQLQRTPPPAMPKKTMLLAEPTPS